jgi:hypothetical protein
MNLSKMIAQQIQKCDGISVIQQALIGQGAWENELLLFVKPEAFIQKSVEQVELILDLVLQKMQDFNVQVDGSLIIGGKVLEQECIMNQHYGLINKLSTSASQLLVGDDLQKVATALEINISDYELLGGHEYLNRYPQETSIDLDQLWFSGRSTKIRSGFYVRDVLKDGKKLVLVNAFHPEQLNHYTNPEHRIVLFLAHSNTDWSELKNKMAGATFPDKADTSSIRGSLYSNPGLYGFESVGVANNAIHLSAGPFEAMFEIANFFGKIMGFDLAQQPSLVLQRMIEHGISMERALKSIENPVLTDTPTPLDLFTATEDMNTGDALLLWNQYVLE